MWYTKHNDYTHVIYSTIQTRYDNGHEYGVMSIDMFYLSITFILVSIIIYLTSNRKSVYQDK